MQDATWIGIDVSKAWLEVAVLPAATIWQVPNDAGGWQALVDDLTPLAATGIVVEATGSYHGGLVLAFHAADLPTTVVNPAWTHAFRRSEGKRAKTDRTDAVLLARYGQQKQPAPTPLPSEAVRHLRELVTCREDFVGMQTMEKNRLKTAPPSTRGLHQEVIATLAAQIDQLEAQIADVIAADEALAARNRLLQSMPGVGLVTSAWLLAALPELGDLDRRAIASLAGLAPHADDSGAHHGARAISGGRPVVRKALYQAASTARQWNPLLREVYATRSATRPHKVAVVACARRMLVWLSAMVRDGLTWKEMHVYRAFHEAPQEAVAA